MLSRGLDGAGPIRAVPASQVIHRWHGRADPQSAKDLGRATGARLVIFGGLLAAGDSVRATLSMLDVASGRTVADIQYARRRRPHGPPLRFADRRRASRDRTFAQHRSRARDVVADDVALRAQGLPARRTVLSSGAMGFGADALRERARDRFDLRARVPPSRDRSLLARSENDIPDSTTFTLLLQASRFQRGLGPRERLLRDGRFTLRRRLLRVAERDPDRQVRRGGRDRSPAARAARRRVHALSERRRSLLPVRGSDACGTRAAS